MRDEIFDRDYQVARSALNGGIDQLGEAIMTVYQTVRDIQFRAPWTTRTKGPKRLA